MEKMGEIVLCILVAVLLSGHSAMARDDVYTNARAHFKGLDGLCLDTSSFDAYHVPTHLSPCESEKEGQIWTFLNDGTIRSNEKCLVPKSNIDEVYAVLVNCYGLSPEDKEWRLWGDGTVTHIHSDRVLTAKPAMPHPLVTLETNEYFPSQSWDVTGDLSPLDVNIVSFNKMCIQAQDVNPHLRLAPCRSYIGKKPWLLVSDGTIRSTADRNLCLTSSGTGPHSPIFLLKCQGKKEQRWNLKKDNTIDNPRTRLVMDVIGSNPYVQQIILNNRNGDRTQEWTIL